MEEFDKIVRYTFTKAEILSSKKDIQELFKNGSSFYLYPFKVVTLPNPEVEQHQVLFSVPKRIFKHAVDRNLLKRRMREAYRLHKHLLPTELKVLNIAYIYTSKEILDYTSITNPLEQSLIRIHKHVAKNSK
ncbi:MAG: ribonuclease P protein component [Cyclobacteriaceae bacterium]|nr:ribonuclease P protein component [Cyclobacteriaceae bacterium]